MRVFVNNLTPEHPDPEDEAYWDFMADSLNMRRYDDEGTRPNSIDLTMTTQQGARTHITQVVSFRAPHNGKPPVLEIHDEQIGDIHARIVLACCASPDIRVDDYTVYGGNGVHYTEFDIHAGTDVVTVQLGHDDMEDGVDVGLVSHASDTPPDYNTTSIEYFDDEEEAADHILERITQLRDLD